ncbi:PP2C family protein-serine/threonine phosphatase [Labilithrix luteola]|nr:protein phosphatase 2C domain-containing protein [Labilithrix luteola]
MSDVIWVLSCLVSLVLAIAIGRLWSGGGEESEDATPAPTPKARSLRPSSEADRSERITVPVPQANTDSHEADTPQAPVAEALPRIDFEDDEEVEPTLVGKKPEQRLVIQPPAFKILYDVDAADDEPTQAKALIFVSARAQTDRGLKRKRNEDSLLVRDDEGLYVVADGMGGYNGGEIASGLAVKTIDDAFTESRFEGVPHATIPPRASELARAIQMANVAIQSRAESERELTGMGTTICAARFLARKQRLYVGHVGDSRLYRLRNNELSQMTSDHTMRDYGVTGADAAHLSRAVGVWPTVPIDVIVGKPEPGDLYLVCSDGLTKMLDDDRIRETLLGSTDPKRMVDALIKAANDSGGKDNVTVIVVRVDPPAEAPERAA